MSKCSSSCPSSGISSLQQPFCPITLHRKWFIVLGCFSLAKPKNGLVASEVLEMSKNQLECFLWLQISSGKRHDDCTISVFLEIQIKLIQNGSSRSGHVIDFSLNEKLCVIKIQDLLEDLLFIPFFPLKIICFSPSLP